MWWAKALAGFARILVSNRAVPTDILDFAARVVVTPAQAPMPVVSGNSICTDLQWIADREWVGQVMGE
jgi:hypothetical protein